MSRGYCMTGGDGQVHESGHTNGLHGDGRVCHRVVVIAPEYDSNAAKRLDQLLAEAGYACADFSVLVDALRSLLPSPKPDEPRGLGAVVRDAAGNRWVRASLRSTVNHWRSADESGIGRKPYSRIDAVEVLSEGVTP